MAQFCQVFRCIFCFCAVDTICYRDIAAIHGVHCSINCFACTYSNFNCTAAFCTVTEQTCNRTHHVLDRTIDLFICTAHHVCHTCCRTCTCYHRATNGAQTANMFFHVHDHQHCHEFCSQQFFFCDTHSFSEYSHRQCCGDTLVTAATECHNRAVTAPHTEVCCCRRDHSYCVYNVIAHQTFCYQVLCCRTYAEAVFFRHTDFCDFHVHVDRFSDKAQFFYIYFICPVIEFSECMFCYVKSTFFCFLRSNKFCCTVVQQNFAVLFCIYHVVMSIFCDCMRFASCIGSHAFNVETAAFQNFYSYHACFYQFLRFCYVFGFDIRTDFHCVTGFGQQSAQNTSQFNTASTCVGNLYAVRIFENIRADHHIQFFCGVCQIFTCSGNRQSDSNRFCTAHAGFHFGFDCIYYYFHIHNLFLLYPFIRFHENIYPFIINSKIHAKTTK